jgi:arylsulfatase A-like enzyme
MSSTPLPRRRAAAPAAALLTVAVLLSSTGCGGDEGPAGVEPLPAKSNVLLITTDTLRADHLGSYGYARGTSPNLDRLAAEGVRFDQPAVQWPKTGPSFASMFTATYPKDNGIVRRIGQPLPCRFRMLAEALREAGYQTHAVVANAAVSHEFYFDQGFDSYVEAWEVEPPDGIDPTGAEAVTRLAVGLLERLDETEKPWFLWVHYLDPHFPYTPPGEWADRFQGDEHFDPAVKIDVTDRPRQQMMGIGREQVLDGRDELAFYVARYDAEIAYNDHWIGELLAAARQRELLEQTLTVFTSDHGESLGDHHYYFDHGRFGFQTCLRVPLILHYPGVLEPRVDADPVELVDLAPTILEAAGVELEEGAWMQGRSLTPRLRGVAGTAAASQEGGGADGGDPRVTAEGHRLAFSEAGWEMHNKWQKVVRDERWKLVFAQTRPEQQWIGGAGVRFTLYDLAEDPGETVNVADEHPEELERLQRELWAWENADRFPVAVEPASAECGDEREMQDETREILKSLGYLQ